MPDTLVRAIDAEAGLRVVAAITTDLCREAAERHGTVGISACALGRALSSSLLLATLTKGEERVTVQFQGDGPIGGITVDAILEPHSVGQVRGYAINPRALATPSVGRGRVVDALGHSGVVNVLRDIGLGERYQGQVALLTGEIDEDVESYLRTSEQVPSALGCDVLQSDGLTITAAAGVLIQSLPGATNEEVWELQHHVRTGAVYHYLADGGRDARALAQAVYGKPLQFVGEQPVRFQCRCSSERIHDMMQLLSVADLDEIIAERGQAEVTCNYCNTRYVVEKPELEEVRAKLAGRPREAN